MGQSSSNSKDFELKLTKEWVKQGRDFTSILESSDKYGQSSVYWKISGYGITEKDLEDGKLKGTGTLKKKGYINTPLNWLATIIGPRIRH